MYLKMILVLLVSHISIGSVQTRTCPMVPMGLLKATSLEWRTDNKIINVQIGANDQNKYLLNSLNWDVFSGKLTAVTESRTVDALQLIDSLNLADVFFSENDASHL